jgi:cytochrome c553
MRPKFAWKAGSSVRHPTWRLSRALCFEIAVLALCCGRTPSAAEVTVSTPAWAFPLNSSSALPAVEPDATRPVHGAHTQVAFTRRQLSDRFSAPDWHPAMHSGMPAVVSGGRPPDLYACGYCHMPGGQGRPENAALAGLPAAYIIQQVRDMKSGARRSAGPGSFAPTDLMQQMAVQVSADELVAAADYFSSQHMTRRVEILERAAVPHFEVRGWVYVAQQPPGSEALGERLLEFTPDLQRHENRDDELRYRAYVPLGSIMRGRRLARSGTAGPATACIACHGVDLRGIALVPPLAGRSPSYLLRQLLAFKTGSRNGMGAQPMRGIVAALDVRSMSDSAAYAASLPALVLAKHRS